LQKIENNENYLLKIILGVWLTEKYFSSRKRSRLGLLGLLIDKAGMNQEEYCEYSTEKNKQQGALQT
jgi:hypothetical protein